MSEKFIIEKLNSSTGQIYLGVKVKSSKIFYYLNILRKTVGLADYLLFTNNQKLRDKGQYHLTLISPDEFLSLSKLERNRIVGEEFDLTLLGLGMASKNEASVYYIVSKSDFGSKVRKMLNLRQKDFHITIGFNESDIHNVAKDSTTILSTPNE